jgi:DNA-directed RNA polymerase specialized sigma24 family protein
MHDPTGYLYRTAMNRFRSRLRSARAAEDLLVALLESGRPTLALAWTSRYKRSGR